MDVWVGSLIIGVGLVSCFFGYPLFRILLIAAGLIGGYLIGQSLFLAGPEWLAFVVSVSAAIIMTFLAYPLWSIGIFVIGAALGFLVLNSIALMLNTSQTFMILLALSGAAVMGFLFYYVRDVAVMLITALYGGVEIAYGIGLFIPAFAFRYGRPNLLVLGIVFVLGGIGFAAQYGMFKDRRTYSISITPRK